MENNNSNIGMAGEKYAQNYLIKRGYKILFINYRLGFDEIDIVAQSFEGILIFIEVKAIKKRSTNFGQIMPEDQLTQRKSEKLIRGILKFVAKHPTLVDDDLGWRMDLIAILFDDQQNFLSLKHYENI